VSPTRAVLLAAGLSLVIPGPAAAGPLAEVARLIRQASSLLDSGELGDSEAATSQARQLLLRLGPGSGSATLRANLHCDLARVYRRQAEVLETEYEEAALAREMHTQAARFLSACAQLQEQARSPEARESLEARVELARLLLEMGRPRDSWGVIQRVFDEDGKPLAGLSAVQTVEALAIRSRAEWAHGWKRSARKTLEKAKAYARRELGTESDWVERLKEEPAGQRR
jgi:hypothetical protein